MIGARSACFSPRLKAHTHTLNIRSAIFSVFLVMDWFYLAGVSRNSFFVYSYSLINKLELFAILKSSTRHCPSRSKCYKRGPP